MLDGEEYFTCCCGSFDHTLRFILDLDRGHENPYPTLYAEIQMIHYHPWYKRLWIGIKYIFGIDTPNPYSCWEINKKSDDPDRLIELLQKLKNEMTIIDKSD